MGALPVVTALAGILLASGGCKITKSVPKGGPFADSFDRKEIGDAWLDTGGDYKIVDGRINVSEAYNHPLWLKPKMPRDAVIELDVMSRSESGDIKIEPYGDGEAFDPDKGGYVSTGYMFIFGGWHNSLSVICRNNEHDDGRKVERKDTKVVPGRWYHWTITRKGGAIDWKIDGQPFLAWTDPSPLAGSGHDHFAFNNWESDVFYDNLKITPAP